MAVLLKPGELVAPEQSLFLPGGVTPKNFCPGPGVKVEMVTSDMYNICERLRELNDRLLIHEVTDAGGAYHYYSICERIPIEGGYKDELVFTCDELDNRAVEYVRYLIKVPLSERMKAIEKIEADHEAAHRENELDELYENMGRAMWFQFEHDGFIESRGKSFPKRGVTGGKRTA